MATKYPELIIPKHCFPKKNYNVKSVYRLVTNNELLSIRDFLPSIIEWELRKRSRGSNLKKLQEIVQQNKCGDYSCSVFEDVDKMIVESVSNNVIRYKNVIVKGDIDFGKGMTTSPSETTHINYYLYDYVDNNPYLDFKIMTNVEDYLNDKNKK